MKKISPLIIALFLFQISYSQQVEDITLKWKRNSFSTGISVCGLCGSATGTYERLSKPKMINLERKNKPFTEQWLFRLESGYYGNWDIASSLLINPQVGYMRSLAKVKNKIEVGAGIALLSFIPDYSAGGTTSKWRPSVYLGYRRQKPEKRNFIRVGASYPQGGYFSFGLYTKSR